MSEKNQFRRNLSRMFIQVMNPKTGMYEKVCFEELQPSDQEDVLTMADDEFTGHLLAKLCDTINEIAEQFGIIRNEEGKLTDLETEALMDFSEDEILEIYWDLVKAYRRALNCIARASLSPSAVTDFDKGEFSQVLKEGKIILPEHIPSIVKPKNFLK